MNKIKLHKVKLWLYFIIPFLLVLSIKTGRLLFNEKEGNYQPLTENDLKTKTRIPTTVDYIFDVKPILSDRCYLCHGPDEGTREAGLRLDIKENAFGAIGIDLDRYAIIPGNIEKSQLVYRINNPDLEKRMPPVHSNLSLSDYEKQILTKWVKQGAEWKDHWAFVAPQKVKVSVSSTTNGNEIDNFIISKLLQKGLKPSQKAKKEKLIRRVYFDLIGLPPTLEAIDDFVNDSDQSAYEKVVDQLLDSQSYGEKMASEWLDISRYADTHGYQDDLERIMWPWRDWVIYAFNKNLSYNKFIKWQLAGDLIPDANLEQIVATGFNRNHKITQEGGVIDEEYRVEYVMDRANTTSKSLIGLTMECARCHDHKYDPISQKDFYGFYAFFNQIKEKGRIEYNEIPEPNIKITAAEIENVLSFVKMPDSIKEVKLMVMKEEENFKRKTYVLNRGTYDNPTEEVKFGAPAAVLPFSSRFKPNRLGLVEWLFDDKNPLTSRVAVNRLWQQMFGRGIVSTSADFGNQGDLPSHPELLDWLSVTFKEEGWDIKKMLKKIAMSNTYQQSSVVTAELLEIDPENKYLARSSRNKLTAEMIRDNALAVSGLLVHKIGGPSVKPYQPEGLWAETTSGQGLTNYILDTGENLYRRSLYTFWKRTVPPPAMTTFDAASRDDCTVKRQKTSTPLQALVMLNDPQLLKASKTLAISLLRKTMTDEERIITVFRKITSRKPEGSELENLKAFLEMSESNFIPMKMKITNPDESGLVPKKVHGLTVLVSLVFNLDEAIVKG
tara:strand:- start:1573 stop:3912 length:2340 start_codon:yes stop_codon:yes gene_type:complete